MGRNRSRIVPLLAATGALAAMLFCAGCEDQKQAPAAARFLHQIDWMENGIWLKADTYIHSRFSDRAHAVSELALKAIEHGCDVIAVTDHADRNLQAATEAYAEAIEVARRAHPRLIVLAGLEWNIPPWAGDEHATVIMPPTDREFALLAEFKSRFDDFQRSDHNASLVNEALEWLRAEASSDGMRPLVLCNHPGRKADNAAAVFDRMTRWRKVNDLVVGFSGAPGHQANPVLGSYDGAVKLVDRWHPAPLPGNAWDHLLQQGIDVWAARAASDFHSPRNDYWPGQFSETWLYAAKRTPRSALEALQAGSFFADHGHIVRDVQFRVTANGLSRPAYPGEIVEVPAGDIITATLDAVIPAQDYSGSPNRIDSVELILTSPDDVQVKKIETSATDRIHVTETLPAPEGGIVLRARGRRVVTDGPDLMFYTNPIRIQTTATSSVRPAHHDGTRRTLVLPKFNSGMLRRIAGGAIILLAIASLLMTQLKRPGTRQRPVSVIQPADNPPRRMQYLAAAMFFTLLAIYGSLVPLRYTPVDLQTAVDRFRSIPYLDINLQMRADWVANILLFVPIGCFWMATAAVDEHRKGRRYLWAGMTTVGCAAASVSLEFTQIWFPPRTVSQNDILAETIGGFIGVGLWLAVGQTLTNWARGYTGTITRKKRIDWMLQVYVAGLILYSLMPLDLTISPAELYQKYREGKIVLVPFWKYSFGSQMLWDNLADVALFVPVGAFVARRVAQRRSSSGGGFWAILGMGFAIVASIEIGQLFVYQRHTDATDLIMGTLGVLLGICLVRRYSAVPQGALLDSSQQIRWRLIWHVGAFLFAVLLFAIFWWPLQFEQDTGLIRARLDGFFRVPFAALYRNTEFNALTDISRKVLLFAVLGALSAKCVLSYELPDAIRRIFLVAASGACIALGTIIELGQTCFPPHIADVTDVILYAIGVFLGMLLLCRLTALPDVESEPIRTSWTSYSTNRTVTALADRRWLLLIMPLLAAIGIAVWLEPWSRARRHVPSGLLETSYRISGDPNRTFFTEIPAKPFRTPRVSEIPIPDFAGAYAIWGATGADQRGHIWIGVSAHGVQPPSAHLFEYIPDTGEMIDRGSVVTELKRSGVYRNGEGQMKIHSKIIQGPDGCLYFASMDEQGEREDGSHLPVWGSHLWRLRLTDYRWEHLRSVPEGLIAVSGAGRWIYALGLFGHVLYQFDTETDRFQKVRVGSVGGHISRNFLTDQHGHAYVPRVQWREGAVPDKPRSRKNTDLLQASLVEYDDNLHELARTPLEHYGADTTSRSHGIIGLVYMADGSIVFSTHEGYLYRITPSAVGPAEVTGIGWFDPEGSAYTPSLFTFAGVRYLAGHSQHKEDRNRWIVYDLVSGRSEVFPLETATNPLSSRDRLVLYGSITRDPAGAMYLAGRYFKGNRETPVLLKVKTE